VQSNLQKSENLASNFIQSKLDEVGLHHHLEICRKQKTLLWSFFAEKKQS
jgi:hypothetical protein